MIFSRGRLIGAAMLAGVSTGAFAQAGLLSGVSDLEPLTFAYGEPLAKAPYELESGKFYRISITADGASEYQLAGPDFFRNVWVNEIVINDIEIRPLGVDSLEFDDEGEVTISFVTIRPGTFELFVPGARGDGQRAVFVVE